MVEPAQLSDLAKAIAPRLCPHCGEMLSVEFMAEVPKETRLSFRITPKQGEKINAQTLGGVIESFGKLLESVGKHMDARVVALIDSIETLPDGTLQTNYLIVRAPEAKPRSRRKAKVAA